MNSRLLTLFLLVGPVLWAEHSQASVVITRPYHGVTYIERSEVLPRSVNIHIAVIDLKEMKVAARHKVGVNPFGGGLRRLP